MRYQTCSYRYSNPFSNSSLAAKRGGAAVRSTHPPFRRADSQDTLKSTTYPIFPRALEQAGFLTPYQHTIFPPSSRKENRGTLNDLTTSSPGFLSYTYQGAHSSSLVHSKFDPPPSQEIANITKAVRSTPGVVLTDIVQTSSGCLRWRRWSWWWARVFGFARACHGWVGGIFVLIGMLGAGLRGGLGVNNVLLD